MLGEPLAPDFNVEARACGNSQQKYFPITLRDRLSSTLTLGGREAPPRGPLLQYIYRLP